MEMIFAFDFSTQTNHKPQFYNGSFHLCNWYGHIHMIFQSKIKSAPKIQLLNAELSAQRNENGNSNHINNEMSI